MAYAKAKLKSSGDKASPYFKLFLVGNVSDEFGHCMHRVSYFTSLFVYQQLMHSVCKLIASNYNSNAFRCLSTSFSGSS